MVSKVVILGFTIMYTVLLFISEAKADIRAYQINVNIFVAAYFIIHGINNKG